MVRTEKEKRRLEGLRRSGGRRSALNNTALGYEIHDLLDIPLSYHGHPQKGMAIIQAVWTAIKDALLRGEKVHIRGFGTFKVITKRPHRTGNNFLLRYPDSRSPVPLEHPPRKVVIFQPSIQLRAILNRDNPSYQERKAMETWD